MNKELVLQTLRNVPDFPKKGIQFKDVDSLFSSPECLQELTDELERRYRGRGITKVVGLDSRGFVMGAILAQRIGAGFVMCRKKGKLPGRVRREIYEKEYGSDSIEISEESICADDIVLVHDDLLATGGTLAAACRLVRSFAPRGLMANVLLELRLEGLCGRDALDKDTPLEALLTIDN